MSYAWKYVEDELLLAIYRKAVEEDFGSDFIEFVFTEIKRRNLISDKPIRLIRIK